MKSLLTYFSWLFFGRPIKQKLRSGAIQSLKVYIKVIGGARKASMAAVLGVFALSSIAIGFFMLVGGLLWLANLNPQAYPWIMIIVGALLTFAGIGGFIFAFREKLWVEMSRINELTEAALARFPANERQTNPAVTAVWAQAAEARIREHSRLETERQATAAAFSMPTPRTPVVETSPHVAPTMQPAT